MNEVPEGLRELQLDYLSDVREKAGLIRQHARDLENKHRFKTAFPVLLFLSHQLKGSGGSLGFREISELAKKMSTELNLFLDDESAERPTPRQLARNLTTLVDDLEARLSAVEASLGH